MELLQFARSRRGGELIGIVILAAGICLALALVTYHPDDSSAFYTSTNSVVANWIGYYGATIAWIFVGFLGFASLLFPAALLMIGWNRIFGKDVEYLHTKLIGFVILVLTLPPLFDLSIGKLWFRGALIPSGGYLGQEICRASRSNLSASCCYAQKSFDVSAYRGRTVRVYFEAVNDNGNQTSFLVDNVALNVTQ